MVLNLFYPINRSISIKALQSICILCSIALCLSSADAQRLSGHQVENPIYIADSPTASDTLLRIPELLAQGNLNEASRLVETTIIELGDRLIESEDEGIYVDVRHRYHHFVLNHPDLLEAYRRDMTPKAQAWLEENQWQRVARDAWLTAPGYDASLRLAQTLIEAAHFQAGQRVLNELLDHPDANLFAKQTTPIARRCAIYLNTNDSLNLYQQWASLANIKPSAPNTNISPPARGKTIHDSLVWNADLPSPKVSLAGVVPGSMGKEPLTPVSQIDQIQSIEQPRLSGANITPTAWTSPIVVGSMLYTNDGITVSCFDRFSLRPIWRVSTTTNAQAEEIPKSADARARLGRVIEDTTTLSADGKYLYVPTGIPRGGQRTIDARIIKVDADNGHIEWSVNIKQLDDSLKDASIRGQVIVDQGMVIIGARTNNRKQRLISFSVVCLDAATGKLLWIRQIASAGSLPFQQMGQLAHSPVLHHGVVYWTDHIGLGFAIETATGQILWARSLPPPDLYARFSRPSFSSNTPIITKYGLFTLSTDGTQILQLDLHSGKIIASRQAEPVGEAFYLLAVGDRLACISQFRVIYFPLERFATSTRTRSKLLGDTDGIRGRVVVADNQLIVPVEGGIEILDPNRAQESQFVELDAVGNIIALDGQVIVVDDMYVSSFLAWNTASAMLRDRIEQDPLSAITLAELAFRAKQTDQVVPAVNAALDVINTMPIDDRQRLKDQLFDVVLDMVEPAHRSKNSKFAQETLSTSNQRLLLDTLSSIARTHEQVVAHRMALGSWNDLRGNKSDAIRAYQDILDQPTLRASMWEGSGIAVRGGLEATRRIRTILEEVGYRPYRSFDKLAQTERSFIEAQASPQDFEQLAKRYPWSTSTPAIWLDAANTWMKTNQIAASIHAAGEGLDAARSLKAFNLTINQETINRLAGLAIGGMIQTNRAKDAETLATTLSVEYPDLQLVINGQTITREQIVAKAKAAIQLPKLGNRFIRDDRPILLTGSPIKPATRIDSGGVLLYAPQLGRIEYVRAGRNVFETVWSRKSAGNEPPVVPWQDETRTLILWPDGAEDNTGTLEAIETTTGRVVWSIEHVHTKLTENSTRIPDDLARVDGQFLTPTQGIAPIHQLILVCDGHSIVLSDRVGRAMGIDLFSGKQLWKADLPANRIFDMDLNGGVLGICGVMIKDQAGQDNQGESVSIAASIDPRSGESIQILDRFGQSPRWVRVSSIGNLYIATLQRLLAINTNKGDIDWVVNDEGIVESDAGWIDGDSLYVLDGNSDIWAFSLDEGTHPINPLDMRDKIVGNGWIQVQSNITNFLVASTRGYLAYDQQHELIASDPINTGLQLLDVAWGIDHLVFLESATLDNQLTQSKLYLLNQEDATLLDSITLSVPSVLDRRPTSITPITGGVIVGYNEVSIFIRTQSTPQTSRLTN